MGACHPMATLKYIDSVTSFPQIICYIVVLKVLKYIFFSIVHINYIFYGASHSVRLPCSQGIALQRFFIRMTISNLLIIPQ